VHNRHIGRLAEELCTIGTIGTIGTRLRYAYSTLPILLPCINLCMSMMVT